MDILKIRLHNLQINLLPGCESPYKIFSIVIQLSLAIITQYMRNDNKGNFA